jgi:hypothetical protein
LAKPVQPSRARATWRNDAIGNMLIRALRCEASAVLQRTGSAKGVDTSAVCGIRAKDLTRLGETMPWLIPHFLLWMLSPGAANRR